MNPTAFVELLKEQRATAILRTALEHAVAPAMEAAIQGGFKIVEFTLNTPGALSHIKNFAARPGIVVGAGTVLTAEEARQAVDHGARFLVSPVVDTTVIAAARELGVAVIPGTHTPTELLQAHRAGAPLQKLFPAPANGPAYLRACLGPMPFLQVVPTSGVDGGNVGDWLDAGAVAVGFVAPLFDAKELESGRFDAVEQRARELLAAVRRRA